MKIRYGLFLLVLLTLATGLSAQKILQLEKSGQAKTKKYFIGDELTFTLKDDPKYWYTETINDIKAADNLIVFTHRAIAVEDITAIRSYRPSRWSQPIAIRLYIFGLSWGAFSGIASLADDEWKFGRSDLYIMGSSFALGFLISKVFRYKTYRMGKKRRLRLLDLG